MNEFGPIITSAAESVGLRPTLVAAIIQQESAGNPYAIRYEQKFRERYLSRPVKQLPGAQPDDWNGLSIATEITARATSWGLMQVMGQVARESGFTGKYLSELLDPETNIRLGTSIFAEYLAAFKNEHAALQRWNGGGNPTYAEEVLAKESGKFVSNLLRSK